MKLIQKIVLTSPDQYLEKHLNIINGLFPNKLTNKEIEVLAAFMSLHKELTRDTLFNTETRKRVRTKLGMIPAGLSHHTRNMIKKGFIYKDKELGLMKVRDYLFPEDGVQGYQFKLEIVKEK